MTYGNIDEHTHVNYGYVIGWSPGLASKVNGQMGYIYIDFVFFRSMALDWYSEAVAPPTTLCTMGVSCPSRRGTGNDGLERVIRSANRYSVLPH